MKNACISEAHRAKNEELHIFVSVVRSLRAIMYGAYAIVSSVDFVRLLSFTVTVESCMDFPSSSFFFIPFILFFSDDA